MNRYGRMAAEHYHRHLPERLRAMADPHHQFTDLGAEIQASITRLRDDLLGPIGTDESPEAYRHRSYQALRQAEEVVLAEALVPPSADETEPTDDPAVERHRSRLAMISDTAARLDRDWTETLQHRP